jgi:hypothetical protein
MADLLKRSLASSEDEKAEPPTPRTEKKPRKKIAPSSDDEADLVPHGVDFDLLEKGPAPLHEDVIQYLPPSDATVATDALKRHAKSTKIQSVKVQRGKREENFSDTDDEVPIFAERNGEETLNLKAGGAKQ